MLSTLVHSMMTATNSQSSQSDSEKRNELTRVRFPAYNTLVKKIRVYILYAYLCTYIYLEGTRRSAYSSRLKLLSSTIASAQIAGRINSLGFFFFATKKSFTERSKKWFVYHKHKYATGKSKKD